MSNENNKITEIELIQGGRQVSIKIDGEPKEIKVRQLKPKELDKYIAAEDRSEVDALAFVTGLDPDQINDLSMEDYENLVEANEDQNFSFAQARRKRMFKRTWAQLQLVKKSDPAMYAELRNKMVEVTDSPASQPASQPVDPLAGQRRPRA